MYFKKDWGREGHSICQWVGNEYFQYGILRFWEKYGLRFWEKYGWEMVFSTLDGSVLVITGKNSKKLGLVIIENGILIFGHL